MCWANDGVEDITHFLLSCHLYIHLRVELLNIVSRLTGTNVICIYYRMVVSAIWDLFFEFLIYCTSPQGEWYSYFNNQ